MIGISIAGRKEWNALLNIYNKKEDDLTSYPYGEYFTFTINNKEVIFYRCGTRKTKSSGATQYMISNFNLEKVIVIGTSAGMDTKYNLLDIFIPNKALQVDCSYIEDGDDFNKDYIIDIDLSKYGDEFKTCTIGSSDKAMIYKEVCDLMYSKGLTLIDMESAPIAYICKVNNVECIIIKGISDFPSNFDFNDSEQFQEYVRNIPVVMEKICTEYLEKFI